MADNGYQFNDIWIVEIHLCKPLKKKLMWQHYMCARTLFFQILLEDTETKKFDHHLQINFMQITLWLCHTHTHSGTSETPRLKPQVLRICSRNSTIRLPSGLSTCSPTTPTCKASALRQWPLPVAAARAQMRRGRSGADWLEG